MSMGDVQTSTCCGHTIVYHSVVPPTHCPHCGRCLGCGGYSSPYPTPPPWRPWSYPPSDSTSPWPRPYYPTINTS